jgi:peptidoglycan/xylan/chitin deacetylase (PgdA/CDA1 family)
MNPCFDLPILMYHHIEPDGVPITPYAVHAGQFVSQLDRLCAAGFTTLSFQDLFAALEGKAKLPAKPVIVTFDDGYESFRKLALPAMISRRMKATVFVVAGEIGGFNRWDSERGIPRRQLLDEAGIRAVMAAGMEIGAHGWAHRNLCECPPPELEEEIFRSKKELESRFGAAQQMFSYPYGAHSKEHFPLLQRAGYSGAVSIFSDQPAVTSNLFSMRRIYVHAGDTAWRFRFKLSPLYLRYVAWRARRGVR